jgi:hypothetical protein
MELAENVLEDNTVTLTTLIVTLLVKHTVAIHAS